MKRVEFLRVGEVGEFERARGRFVGALAQLEGFDVVLDMPLVEEVVRSAVYVRRGERYLDDPQCSPGTYAVVSDAMAKHAARMRGAIKDLAASRAERLKTKSASGLADELKKIIDKVIQEE